MGKRNISEYICEQQLKIKVLLIDDFNVHFCRFTNRVFADVVKKTTMEQALELQAAKLCRKFDKKIEDLAKEAKLQAEKQQELIRLAYSTHFQQQ
jgi:hypothetical protein